MNNMYTFTTLTCLLIKQLKLLIMFNLYTLCVFFQSIVTKYRANPFFVVQSSPFTHKIGSEINGYKSYPSVNRKRNE